MEILDVLQFKKSNRFESGSIDSANKFPPELVIKKKKKKKKTINVGPR